MDKPKDSPNCAFTEMLPNSQIHFSIKEGMTFKDVVLHSDIFVDIESYYDVDSGKLQLIICGSPKVKNIIYG